MNVERASLPLFLLVLLLQHPPYARITPHSPLRLGQ